MEAETWDRGIPPTAISAEVTYECKPGFLLLDLVLVVFGGSC
jgi:hypothetical protein